MSSLNPEVRPHLRYAITDRRALQPASNHSSYIDFQGSQRTQDSQIESLRLNRLIEVARTWILADMDYIQIREKDLSEAAMNSLIEALWRIAAASTSRTRVLISLGMMKSAFVSDIAGGGGNFSAGEPALWMRLVNGIHLPAKRPICFADGPETYTPAQLRQLWLRRGYGRKSEPLRFREPVFSTSCHTLAEVEQACVDEIDLLLFGPVFGKTINGREVVAAAGLALLEQACRLAGTTPVLALGGVTAANTNACLAAGAAGVAGIRLFSPGV